MFHKSESNWRAEPGSRLSIDTEAPQPFNQRRRLPRNCGWVVLIRDTRRIPFRIPVPVDRSAIASRVQSPHQGHMHLSFSRVSCIPRAIAFHPALARAWRREGDPTRISASLWPYLFSLAPRTRHYKGLLSSSSVTEVMNEMTLSKIQR